MTLEHKDIMAEVNDWLGAWFFRTVQDLATNNCRYSPERDLVRAELHGERLEKVITPVLGSINSLVRNAQMADQVSKQILPELRNLDIQSAKAKVLQQIDSMPSSKVRERVFDVISYIYLQKARGCAIDLSDEAFLQLNADEQEAFVRRTVKQLVDASFSQLRRYFLVTLNRIRKGKVSFETCPFIKEVSRFLPWRATLDLVHLANTPSVTSRFLCLENKAVVEDREAIHGWDGDTNKAFEFLDSALRVELQLRLKMKGWHIPGARYRGIDNWEEPLNDEHQLLQIGELNGLEWARKQSLSELLVKGASGELRNALMKAAENELLMEIRRKNRQLGVGALPNWIKEGVGEEKKAHKEVLDYGIQTAEGETSTLIEKAGYREAFQLWAENEVEQERAALIFDKIEQLRKSAHLTRREELVLVLHFTKNMTDEEIAIKLKEKFGKEIGHGQVRKLRHTALKKLKSAA